MTEAHQIARGDRPDRGSPAGVPATTVIHPGQDVVTGDQTARPARLIMVTGARGGQGTTTVAVALAVYAAAYGDVALAAAPSQGAAVLLGVPAIERGGSVEATRNVTLTAPPVAVAADTVVIDGGLFGAGQASGGETYVVLRGPCYVALATLLACHAERPDGIILVAEEGRSLTARDVSEVTGLPVVAMVTASSRVARTIDAGLLISRLSRLHELDDLRRIAAPTAATPRSIPEPR